MAIMFRRPCLACPARSMAFRMAMLKSSGGNKERLLPLQRLLHVRALPALGGGAIDDNLLSPPLVSPEFNRDSGEDSLEKYDIPSYGFHFPSFVNGASMELMAVPKRKVSPHKRGLRNGPKALKPIPVIVRCKSCGRVKLPHFFCCSGDRGNTGTHDSSTR